LRVIEPCHKYASRQLDGIGEEITTFVKREGAGYPGNVGAYPGRNLQDGWRIDIDRVGYLNRQEPHWVNGQVQMHLRAAIALLEFRAAERHGRIFQPVSTPIELEPFCELCGHIQCGSSCREETI
jgi:hypothetical protein